VGRIKEIRAIEFIKVLRRKGMKIVRCDDKHLIMNNPRNGKTTAITLARKLSPPALMDSLNDLELKFDEVFGDEWNVKRGYG
jgi:predicted RNA binding protein YcfA (HicA-like mRNA interferase family)